MTVTETFSNSETRDLLRTLKVFEGNLKPFDTASAPTQPMHLFDQWFQSAVREGAVEPHAMTLGTVDEQGCPSLRTLILKDYDDEALYFASSARSRKGQELAAQPSAALNFYWREFGRQIRVCGAVAACTRERSSRDFAARSVEARAEAMLGRQSQPLDNWSDWEQAIAISRLELTTNPDLTASDWTLYALTVTQIEFWQADRGRRHERLQYWKTPQGWSKQMLWP